MSTLRKEQNEFSYRIPIECLKSGDAEILKIHLNQDDFLDPTALSGNSIVLEESSPRFEFCMELLLKGLVDHLFLLLFEVQAAFSAAARSPAVVSQGELVLSPSGHTGAAGRGDHPKKESWGPHSDAGCHRCWLVTVTLAATYVLSAS